jgi:hypothetical protein
MTILARSWQPPFAGSSHSRRCAGFIPAPASPAGHLALVLNHTVEHGSSGQSAIISGFHLSPILGKPSLATAAATPNPHRRPTAHRCPAGSFFGGFRTPASIPVNRSRRAGIRNPSRLRSISPVNANGSNGWKADLRRSHGERRVCAPRNCDGKPRNRYRLLFRGHTASAFGIIRNRGFQS